MKKIQDNPYLRLIAVVFASACVVGCKGEAAGDASPGDTGRGRIDTDPYEQPKFNFPLQARSDDRSLNEFIVTFTQACIAGEYDKYRLFTSRQIEPFGKEQFERVYRRIEHVDIKEVRPLPRISDLPYPLWMIVSEIHLREVTDEPLRTAMILAFKERDQWVIAPAPRALRDAIAATQPATQPASQPASQPTSQPASGSINDPS